MVEPQQNEIDKAHAEAVGGGWKKTFDRVIKNVEEAGNKDGLTGLLNRMAISKRLRRDILKCQREESTSLTVALFDLDGLKDINDKEGQGHPAGDQVLKGLSELLTNTFKREIDYFGRWGGDEILAVFPVTTVDQIVDKVDETRLAFAKKFKRFNATVSVGLASLDPDFLGPEPMDSLIASADKALYSSKRERNRVSYFEDGKIIDFNQVKATAALPTKSPAKSG